MRRTIALLTALGLMVPLAAHALNEKVWMTLNGGGGKYDMSELNAEIAAFNAANAGSGLAFPLIEDGVSWGGAVGYETPGHWNFGLGLDRLHAATKAGDASGSLDYQFTANAWHAFGDYALQPMGHSSLFVGAAVGILAESGKLIEAIPGQGPLEYKLHGASPLYEAHGGGSWWATPRFALVATAGYRYAKLKSLKVEGGAFITANGEALAVDYTGPYFRLGFKLAGNADQ
jgi:hypothetical protein